jgi:hypothetical protein
MEWIGERRTGRRSQKDCLKSNWEKDEAGGAEMKLFNLVFGCRHLELSRVFTIGGQS